MIAPRDPATGRMIGVDWEVRFFRHFRPGDGCWEWTGQKFKNGYGAFKKATGTGKTNLAHRVSFELANGHEPVGKVVCHRCDNRACVRPSHLFAGTQRDNIQDMIRKGRRRTGSSPGERNGSAKLSEEQAKSLLAMAIDGSLTQREIAARFGVSLPLVQKIKSGCVWGHLPGRTT